MGQIIGLQYLKTPITSYHSRCRKLQITIKVYILDIWGTWV